MKEYVTKEDFYIVSGLTIGLCAYSERVRWTGLFLTALLLFYSYINEINNLPK